MNKRPRLRTLFIIIHLIIFILPLASIFLLRLYESALVRQTEASLIAQASWISASYSQRFRESYADIDLASYGKRVTANGINQQESKWHPQQPTLDLHDSPILSKPPDATLSSYPIDEIALSIAQHLQPILKEVQLTTLAGMRIVDSKGNVVASTGWEFGLSLLNREEVVKALAGHSVRVLRQRISDEEKPLLSSISRGTKARIFLAHPIIIDQWVIGAVILSRTPPDIMQVLYAKRTLLSYLEL
jgi:hypothetical protein